MVISTPRKISWLITPPTLYISVSVVEVDLPVEREVT
jgi:hypothetical protein